MDQRQGRQNLFEHRDRVASVEERRIGRKPELVMIAADQIQAEGVEGADPELGRRLRHGRDQAFGEFAGRSVGERQDQNGRRIDAFGQQGQHPLDQGARLARARAGLQLKRRAAMRGGAVLRWVGPRRRADVGGPLGFDVIEGR